jgi:hypothetical protein
LIAMFRRGEFESAHAFGGRTIDLCGMKPQYDLHVFM